MCEQQALDGMPRKMYLDEPTMKDLDLVLAFMGKVVPVSVTDSYGWAAFAARGRLVSLLEALRTCAEHDVARKTSPMEAVPLDGWYTEAELARAYRELETILPEVQVEFLAKVCTQARKNRLWDSQGA